MRLSKAKYPRREGSELAQGIKQVAAYATFPMMGAITPLIALPSIAHEFGARGWTAIAVGQSVGAAASVAVELGWGLTGPNSVAGSDREGGRRLLSISLVSRLATAVAVAPIVVVVVMLLGPPHVLAAVVAALAMTFNGLSTNWYFVGLGNPARIFWSDSLPRLASVGLGVVAISALSAPLAAYSGLLLLGYLASPCVGLSITRPRLAELVDTGVVRAVFRQQRTALAGRGLSAVYIGLPVALVQALSPSAVPAFAAAERLMRMGLLVLQSIPNSLQRALGVATRDPGTLRRRSRQVLGLQLGVGIFAALVCASALPFATEILLAGKVSIGYDVSLAAGCVVLLTSVSRATGMLLVAQRRVSAITVSAGVAASTAVLLLAVLPAKFGATGAMLALAVAEALALAVQVASLRAAVVRSRGANGE